MKAKGIIFDMDGCLYPFDRGACETFTTSGFYRTILGNIQTFFMNHFGVEADEALAIYQDLKVRFDDEVSLGLEKEHGVPRSDYFAATWDIDPKLFMDTNPALNAALEGIEPQRALLSAAPRIWIDKVTDHLQVRSVFEPYIFSGDPDIRKPDPKAFLQVAEALGLAAQDMVSIGDQEVSDILPAQSLGMRTVRIGRGIGATAADFTAIDVPDAITILRKENII